MRHADRDVADVAECETPEIRGAVEALRMRAHLLTGEDRALLEMHLEHGNSFRQIARLVGRSHQTVGRRIHRIVRRLTDDTYAVCLGNREEFNGRELALIKDHFVCGLSERCISRSRDVPRYRVRAILCKARRYAASIKMRNAEFGVRSSESPRGSTPHSSLRTPN